MALRDKLKQDIHSTKKLLLKHKRKAKLFTQEDKLAIRRRLVVLIYNPKTKQKSRRGADPDVDVANPYFASIKPITYIQCTLCQKTLIKEVDFYTKNQAGEIFCDMCALQSSGGRRVL